MVGIEIDVIVKQPKGENEELFVFASNGFALDTVMPIKVEGNHFYFDYPYSSCCIIAQSEKYEPTVVFFATVGDQKEAKINMKISKNPKKVFANKEEENNYLLLKMRESMPPGLADAVMNHTGRVIHVRGDKIPG